MKIIYVGGNWISRGSNTVYSTYCAYGIAQNNIETHLIVRNAVAGETKELFREYFNLELPENLHVHRIDRFFKHTNTEYYFKASRLIKALSDEQTIVVTRVVKILPYLFLFRNRRFKVFYETHNFFMDINKRDDLSKKPLHYWKYTLIKKHFIPKLDGLVCLSETQKHLWEKYTSIPKFTLFPGLFMGKPAIVKNGQINLAFIGLMRLNKGIDRIMQVASYLPEHYRVILFGGRGQKEVEWLRAMAEDAGVGSKVEVTGWVRQSELHKRLLHVQVGLVPLKNNFFNSYLSSPSKLFDYLTHQIPVVTSSLPVLDELITKQKLGRVVDWDNPQQAAQAIVSLVENTEEYKKLQENIRDFAQKHTWQERGKNLIAYFQNQVLAQ